MTTTHIHTTHSEETPAEAPWDEAHSASKDASEKPLAKRAVDSSTDALRRAKDTVAASTSNVIEKASDQYRTTSAAAKRRYEELSEQAGEAYSKSKTSVQQSFHAHPLAYLAGALATGVALGLVLPRMKKEKAALANAGRKVQETAQGLGAKVTSAAASARDAAKSSLEERGLDPESVKDELKEVGNDSVDAAKQELEK